MARERPGAPARDLPRDLDVRRVTPADVEALSELLAAVDSTYFRPHRMDRRGAQDIVSKVGRDAYFLGYVGNRAVTYGMLRGWDEGYATPSLGIAVRRDVEGRGYGSAMMAALHAAARAGGATAVRLRVHADNARARRLYSSLGYRAAGTERGELVMLLDLVSGDRQVSRGRIHTDAEPGRQSRRVP